MKPTQPKPNQSEHNSAMTNAKHQTVQIRGYCRRNGCLRIVAVLQQCAAGSAR